MAAPDTSANPGDNPRPIRIDRCVCSDVTFAELRGVADLHGAGSLEDLQAIAGVGMNCGLCKPYIRNMLRTGTVVFREIVEDREDQLP